jgi:D-ribulokinase
MEENGYDFNELVICGGLTKSKLFLQMHADILCLPVLIPECSEPVLLGAAVSAQAAYASGETLSSVLHKMAGKASIIIPNEDSQK